MHCTKFRLLILSSMIEASLKLAETIAQKSPVAVQVTKRSLIYSRDHTVDEGLENIVSFFLKFKYNYIYV